MRARKALAWVAIAAGATAGVVACGWDPSKPFERESPAVKQAIVALDAGDAAAGALLLEDYLRTGPCSEGNIGGDIARLGKLSDGTFDLGLALFKIGESFGRRFGEEEAEPATGEADQHEQRHAQVECALHIVRAIANDRGVSAELRARARYLEGNLLFLDKEYEKAVDAYDAAVTISPGAYEGGDPVGGDAAWNRAIALRRIEDKKKDAGPDSPPDAPPDAPEDAPKDAPQDSGNDGGNDAGDSGSDGGGDSGGGNDGGGDSGGDSGSNADASSPNAQDAAPPPPQHSQADERLLDMLENAPTVQQEDAKRRAQKRPARGAIDK